MLADHAPMPTLATADLARAREFYEGTLGFTPADDVAEGVLYRAGNSSFLVYPSSFAGTNKATSMSFNVPSGDFEAIVGDLRGKGVDFDTFDLPVGTWTDGVADFGNGMKGVWFTDPDGNILNVDTMG
ncbi:MAG: VOC family protein [Propionibacteriaceae bacterium]|nr:VOC family protein [Propionibacteriaceae bacterium]